MDTSNLRIGLIQLSQLRPQSSWNGRQSGCNTSYVRTVLSGEMTKRLGFKAGKCALGMLDFYAGIGVRTIRQWNQLPVPTDILPQGPPYCILP